MTTFKDPLRSLSFEHPAGWACDLLYSTLTDFFFARWDRPEEMLVVHLRRASVPVEESDDAWVDQVRKEVGDKSLIDADSPAGRAVAVDFVSGEGMTQRVAFIRGAYVDLAIEHRNADLDAADPYRALSMAIETAVSEANLKQEGESSPVEFNRTIETANKAFEDKNYDAVAQALRDAIQIGTSAWLESLTSSRGAPEINAAVRVSQAMVHLGRFTGETLLLRDAASILRRAICSLESAGKAKDPDAQGLIKELNEVLDSIQSELLEQPDREEAQDSAPIISIRERSFRSAQAAVKAFEAADFEAAFDYAAAAAGDILFLLSYFRRGRAQQIPDEILQHLVDQGISDHEEQRDAIQKAREGVLFPALNLSLQICYCSAMGKENPRAAADAAELYLTLARTLAESSAGDTSIELNLALALMDTVGAAAALQDGGKIKDALAHLQEASGIIDAAGDRQCPDDGWVRSCRQQNGRSLEVLNRWLSRVKEDGDAVLEADLQSLAAGFEKAAGRMQERIKKSPGKNEGAEQG